MNFRILLVKLLMKLIRSRISWIDDDLESMSIWYAIKRVYWHYISYDWRPSQILYRLKCFFFKRYTTIKPRTLKYNTWCDRCVLLPHIMFEILSRFLEEECSPGHIDWYSESCPHKIWVHGEEKWVRDEMQDIYDWWHQKYNKEYEERIDQLFEIAEKHHPVKIFKEQEDGCYLYDPEYKTPDDQEKHDSAFDEMHKLEAKKEAELLDMMQRLVNIHEYMWT